MTQVAELLGVGTPETVRKWVPPGRGRCRSAAGDDDRGVGGAEAVEAGERRAEAGQRDLEGGVGFLRGRTRPATALIVQFIDQHRAAATRAVCGGVSSRSAPCSPSSACKIAPSTYYEHRGRQPQPAGVRDAELQAEIAAGARGATTASTGPGRCG